MANCLRMPMASSLRSSSSVPSPRRRSYGAINSSKIPMPPRNPNDAFASELLSAAAATSPETILNRPTNSDTLVSSDLLEFPKLMATPGPKPPPKSNTNPMDAGFFYSRRKPRRPPPDLPSMFLDGRIVYIGMPLVPAVTELIIAELIYLQSSDPDKPIYLYINSTGTCRADGIPVAMNSEGLAVYDALMQMTCEINTLCLGTAVGQACLLLAAGAKGKRYMLPNAQAMLHEPRIPSSGLMPANKINGYASEVKYHLDMTVAILAKHTGNSRESVAKILRRGPFYMDPFEAKKFGIIDKVLLKEGKVK